MPQTDHQTAHRPELETQKRLARKYKRLGYDVHENPGPDRLPDFMRGAAPDIVARSPSDNVVIEIKRHASLKGSNDIIGIAERVSAHPDWRFELVVLENDQDDELSSKVDYQILLEKVRAATSNQLFDMAFVYLANVLSQAARDLAKKNNLVVNDRRDRTILLDMGFKGILPDVLVEQGLSALSIRNYLAHASAGTVTPSEKDVQNLLTLCEEIRALV